MSRKVYGVYRYPETPKSRLFNPIALGLLLGVALGTTIAAIVFSL